LYDLVTSEKLLLIMQRTERGREQKADENRKRTRTESGREQKEGENGQQHELKIKELGGERQWGR
jgi:hypothetical protein